MEAGNHRILAGHLNRTHFCYDGGSANLQSGPSSFPRAALLITLCVCMRIWDGVGFGVRVSEIKATNLIMIFVSHRVVP